MVMSSQLSEKFFCIVAGSDELMLRPSALQQRPQGSASSPDLLTEQLRLLPCREVPAIIGFVEVDEIAIATLRPATRRLINLSREDRYCDRYVGDIDGVEIVG